MALSNVQFKNYPFSNLVNRAEINGPRCVALLRINQNSSSGSPEAEPYVRWVIDSMPSSSINCIERGVRCEIQSIGR